MVAYSHIHIAYRTIKDIGDENLGKFGKLHHFAKFCANFHNFHKIPMQMDLNSPKFLCQTSYNPYSPNLFAAKVFTIQYCMLLASFNNIAS